MLISSTASKAPLVWSFPESAYGPLYGSRMPTFRSSLANTSRGPAMSPDSPPVSTPAVPAAVMPDSLRKFLRETFVPFPSFMATPFFFGPSPWMPMGCRFGWIYVCTPARLGISPSSKLV